MSKKKIYDKIYANISKNKIALSQSDFKQPYIIDKPGYYYLTEHIEINFYPKKHDVFERNTDHDKFGFAAGIKINTSYVILDLNGYSICQSPQDYCVQRFFSLVQLNSFPFSKGVGPIPANNRELKTGHYCVVKNGTFGLSSHQAIIGNENKNIVIENIGILDFEVTGIMLNNCHNAYLNKITIGHSIGVERFLPITPHFSGLIFIHKLLLHLLDSMILNSLEQKLIEELQNKIENTVNHFLKVIYSESSLTEIYNSLEKLVKSETQCQFLFNKCKLSPCNLHGIKITGKNPSVGKFHESLQPEKGNYSDNIYLDNITIQNLEACIREEAIFTTNGNIIHIAAGVKVSVSLIKHDIIKFIMKTVLKLSENPEIKAEIGTNLNQDIYNFIFEDKKIEGMGITGNVDTMGHINKGTLGIRIGQTSNIHLNHIKVSNMGNKGKNLSEQKKESFKKSWNLEKIDNMDTSFLEPINYTGSFAIGIIVSGSKGVCLYDIETSKISAPHGCAIGLAINNLSEDININDLKIHHLESCSSCFDSASFVLDEQSKNISISNLKVN